MRYTVLITLLFHSTFAFQSCKTTQKQKVSQSIVVEEIKVVEEESFSIDTFQTSLANFIAGVDKSYYDSIIAIDSDFWNEFSGEINENFSKIQRRRLMKMSEWSDSLFIDKSMIEIIFI